MTTITVKVEFDGVVESFVIETDKFVDTKDLQREISEFIGSRPDRQRRK